MKGEYVKRHILIEGARGAGKSTLIRRLISEAGMPVCGFCTWSSAPDETGFHDIYIHPAAMPAEARIRSERNRIGRCDQRIHEVRPEVFESLGVDLLSDVREDGIIVMDELGFMEQDSPRFMDRVIELLRGDVPVIASVKDRHDVAFLDRVRLQPKAELFRLTKETREDLFMKLLPIVRGLRERA